MIPIGACLTVCLEGIQEVIAWEVSESENLAKNGERTAHQAQSGIG
jgi:hypothetical protein